MHDTAPPRPRSATLQRNVVIALAALILLAPLLQPGQYIIHLLVVCLIWSYIYTSWSIMGRLGLVSFGHGAFLGIGAYTGVLLWNHWGVSPWLGLLAGIGVAVLLALAIGYPCFRLKIVGHYFALVTLALSEVVRLVIVGLRDWTGGSLGMTPRTALMEGQQVALAAMQFSSKNVWLYLTLACWLGALYVWHRVDRSMARLALQAISEQEEAAASIGINVRAVKLGLMVLSAAMTCMGGVLYAQYQLYVNPENLSGIGVSLQMVFGVVAGGMFVLLGPTVGAVFLLLLSEGLRLLIGNDLHGLDLMVYGALLVVFIIFMPKGILGSLLDFIDRRSSPRSTHYRAAVHHFGKPSMSEDIQFEQSDGIGVLTLNRPASLNSLSLQSIQALLARLQAIARDDSLRALVITGAGRGFCAGWQLDENGVPGLPDESLGVRQAHLMAEYFNPVIQALHDLPIPTVAAVNGVAAGAGVSIALGADIVLAAESAAFVLTFSPKLGLLPDLGATWKLPRLLGWARAQAITMLGDRISASEAAQWGMVWRAVPDAELRSAALALATRLAASPPGICREVRHAYEAAQQRDLAAQMEYERLRQRELLDSPAFREGIDAFQHKRTPQFHRSQR